MPEENEIIKNPTEPGPATAENIEGEEEKENDEVRWGEEGEAIENPTGPGPAKIIEKETK